jgi:type I restriction enzyme R subunit
LAGGLTGVSLLAGTRPEKGVNKAIAEWETETGLADYALVGLDFIGVVEAKKMGKDVVADLTQSKRYSSGARLTEAWFIEGPWESYRVLSFRPMPAPI